jgi:hypothetical protein
VRRLLGIPMAAASVLTRCGLCNRDLEAYSMAAHLECCGGGSRTRGVGGYHAPHTPLRAAVRAVFQEAGSYAEVETDDLLGTAERPGDVVAYTPRAAGEDDADAAPDTCGALMGQAGAMEVLAVDVTVTRVQAPSHVDLEAAAPGRQLVAAEKAKKDKYAERCDARGLAFTPFAVDEFGGLGPAAYSLLRRLAQQAATGEAAHYTQGAETGERVAHFMRRWTAQISRAVLGAFDGLVQQRLAASCGAAAALWGESGVGFGA